MSFDTMADILNYAIDKEKEAVAFYAELSQNETLSGAKQVFEEFSREEQKHVKMLENFSAKKDAVATYQFRQIQDLKRSDYMVDIEYEKGMQYVDMLRLAMKREEKSLKLYQDLAARSENDEFAKMFSILANEEAMHKNKVETIYDDFMALQGD
jgi:rubrerythrin